MALPPVAQVTHVGLYVRDFDRMLSWYRDIFGLVVTDASEDWGGRRIVFLSRNPEEHHQIVLISGRPDEEGFSPLNQISLRVASLEDLKEYYGRLVARGVRIQRTITHGNAWSIYFFDPEGNRLELYCGTPWYVNQPYGVDMDFTEPVEVIRRRTEEIVCGDPSLQSHEAWSAGLRERLEQQA